MPPPTTPPSAAGYVNIASGVASHDFRRRHELRLRPRLPFIGGGGYDGANTIGNVASGISSAITGGISNNATGNYSMIPGGSSNLASGNFSFAAGVKAQATNNNSFVWSDGTGTGTASATDNTVTMRASGGYRFFSGTFLGVSLAPNATSFASMSDKNVKKNFAAVDAADILEKLAAIPVEKWNYQWESDAPPPTSAPWPRISKPPSTPTATTNPSPHWNSMASNSPPSRA